MGHLSGCRLTKRKRWGGVEAGRGLVVSPMRFLGRRPHWRGGSQIQVRGCFAPSRGGVPFPRQDFCGLLGGHGVAVEVGRILNGLALALALLKATVWFAWLLHAPNPPIPSARSQGPRWVPLGLGPAAGGLAATKAYRPGRSGRGRRDSAEGGSGCEAAVHSGLPQLSCQAPMAERFGVTTRTMPGPAGPAPRLCTLAVAPKSRLVSNPASHGNAPTTKPHPPNSHVGYPTMPDPATAPVTALERELGSARGQAVMPRRVCHCSLSDGSTYVDASAMNRYVWSHREGQAPGQGSLFALCHAAKTYCRS